MTSNSMAEMNKSIIEEFRANEGKVGGHFTNAPVLLLHTIGAHSGIERVNPMMYQDLGNAVAVFASKAGDTSNPDWYFNVVANPEVTAEIGTTTRSFAARVANGQERLDIWEKQKQDYPAFADYEAKTSREIPVVILEPR